MKHWLFSLLCLFLIKPAYAFDLEDKMYLAEHYVSYTTSFDISTDERKLGTLYRRVLSLNTVYDFYDIRNKLISTAQSHFFSFGAHLDIFSNNNELLGTVEERVFTWFPNFELYSPEGVRLATAQMNFWGTTFTLYDGRSERVLAVMSRDFFRLRNYWTIDIKNLERLKERRIDSRLLLTVLAVQGDIEYLEHYRNRDQIQGRRLTMSNPSPKSTSKLSAKIQNKYSDFLKKEAELNNVDLLDSKQLDSLAAQLVQDFQQQYVGTSMSTQEEAERFVDYCMNVAQAADTSPSTQKAILHLLNKRIKEQAGK